MTTALAEITESDMAEVRLRARELRSLLDPEWRYTRARALKSDGVIHFRRSEDHWIVALSRFLKAWSESDVETRPQVEDRFPDVAWAYQIYVSEEKGPRYHIEALIVAEMPTDEIADYLGYPVVVIMAYERLFFDIRQHMSKRGAIRAYISARARARGLRDLDPDPFWKRVALDEGFPMLMALWSDGRLNDVERKCYDEIIASQSRRNAFEAMKVREINSSNANDVIIEYVSLCKNEYERQKVESEIGEGDRLSEFVSGLIHAVQFSVAPVGTGSERAYVELTTAVAQAPKLLERLQGAALARVTEKADVQVHEDGE